jgi:hypothetical protein
MQEIARLVMSKSSDRLDEQSDEISRTIDLREINQRIPEAGKDGTRLVRAMDRMVQSQGLERSGFGWKTTPTSATYFREVLAS